MHHQDKKLRMQLEGETTERIELFMAKCRAEFEDEVRKNQLLPPDQKEKADQAEEKKAYGPKSVGIANENTSTARQLREIHERR